MKNVEEKKSEDVEKDSKSKAAKEKTRGANIQEAHQRLNFLHQISAKISSQSTRTNDGYAKLSRLLGKHFQGVLDTERVKVEADIRRTFCRKCKQVLIAKCKRYDLKMIQRKVMQWKCCHCGYVQNFELNTGYLSRNDKFLRGII